MIYTDKRSFAKGELSPRALARQDIAAFEAGADRIENFVVEVTGGLTRSPGTRFVAEAKVGASAVVLVPFVYARGQAYVLEFGDGYVRFYMNRGRIETGGAPYEVSAPWAAYQLSALTWVQEADVLYLFHPDVPVYKLARLGHANWVLSEVRPEDGPFLDENFDETHTITASAVMGTGITLTVSGADLWDPGHVGSLMRLSEPEPDAVQPWEPARAFGVGEQVRYDGRIYEAVAATGNSGSVPPIHGEGRAWDGQAAGSVQWLYRHNGGGVVRITAVTGPRTATGDVLSRLPDSCVASGTWRWAEGAWSPRRGYPGAATFADQRLVVAGSRDRPTTFWGSVAAGNYERFEAGVEEDLAFRYTLASGQVNPIRWLVTAPVLLLGSAERVWIATGSDFEAPLSPLGVRVRPATEDGVAPVRPVIVGSAVLYLSHTGRRVMELTVDGASGGYSARDLTILADHIALTA